MLEFIDMGAVMLRILEVKNKTAQGSYVTMNECESVRDALSKKLNNLHLCDGVEWKYCNAYFRQSGEGIYTFDQSLNQSLEVAKEWYSRTNGTVFRALDDELIKAVLVNELLKKYEHLVERSCYNCYSNCCGGLSNESAAQCSRWSNDFAKTANKMLTKSLMPPIHK